MVKYIEILHIPKTCREIRSLEPKDKSGRYRVHSSSGFVPWLTREERDRAENVSIDDRDKLVHHFARVIGQEFIRDLSEVVTPGMKKLVDVERAAATTSTARRWFYLMVRHKLNLNVSKSIQERLRHVLASLSSGVRVHYQSMSQSDLTMKVYISSPTHLRAYHEYENALVDKGYLTRDNVVARTEFNELAIWLKCFLTFSEETTLVEVLICDVSLHPFAEHNFFKASVVGKSIIEHSKPDVKLSREVLGYDSPKNCGDVAKLMKHSGFG